MLDDNQKATTFCGTPEYLAPEMVSQSGHDQGVDWWALGILIYEMLIGVTPFFSKNKKTMLEKIQSAKVVFPDRKKYKIEYSDELMDLVVRLLDKDGRKRLGTNGGVEEILSHPIFKNIDKSALVRMELTPPFKPSIAEKDMTQYFNANQSKAAIADTYIPRENRKIVKANTDVF